MKRVTLFILVMIVACKGLQAQEYFKDGFPDDTTKMPLRITGGFPIPITVAPWQVLLSKK